MIDRGVATETGIRAGQHSLPVVVAVTDPVAH